MSAPIKSSRPVRGISLCLQPLPKTCQSCLLGFSTTTEDLVKDPQQLDFQFKTHGGKRAGAGRKPNPGRRRVPHRTRPAVRRWQPQHITYRLDGDKVGTLRSDRAIHTVYRALAKGGDRFQTRLIHFSVQDDHIHLIVETQNKAALTSAMKGVEVRLARGLNKLLGTHGAVISDRYHARALTTPTEVKHAIAYVLKNHRHHAAQRRQSLPRGWIDPFSNGYRFDGWSTIPWRRYRPVVPLPVLPACQTHLLFVLWRKKGLIDIDTIPGRRH